MPFLRQSTASQEVMLGPFLDSTDGVSPENGLTIANTDIRIWKAGTTVFVNKNSGGGTNTEDGFYSAVFDATDANTVGELKVQVTMAGALPVWERWWVLEEVIYDALFGASAAGFDANQRVDVGSWLGTAVATPTVGGVPEVDVTHLDGVAQSAQDLKDFADAGYDPVTNKVQGVVLVDTTTTNTDMRGTDSAALATVVGALADAAAAGDPTSADTIMQYIKQLINVLVGTDGVNPFPVEAAPANAVSLAEVIRAIHTDVTGLNGDAMRGTDSAALATVCTEARLAELASANLPADVDQIKADLPIGITKNVALSDFEFFMEDSTDDISGKTGLTFAAADSQRSIDGGAFGNSTNVPTEVANGIYKVDLSAADLNGDVVTFKWIGTGANVTFMTIKTQPT